ncbi:tetratricopeptide repeat protein [bacterium]|nr:tetratricopeptide repeat protein [bacterium]
MARRKTRSSRSTSSRPDQGGVKPTGSATKAVPVRRQARGFHLSSKTWIIIYVLVFLVVESVIVFAFVGSGGDSRVRRQILLEAAELRDNGEYKEAVELLEDFGKRWPGAWKTHNFNQRMGEYYYDAGDYALSAASLKRAVDLDGTIWDTRALAGRSLWKLDQREEAVKYFQDELQKANKNSDIAHYYLGQWALANDQPVAAFEHFQAIQDPTPWEKELKDVTAKYHEEVLEPARKEAEARAAELLP